MYHLCSKTRLYNFCGVLTLNFFSFHIERTFFVILLTDGEPFMHRNIFSLDYIHKSENPHKAKKCAYLFVFCKIDAKLQKNLKGSLLFHITDLFVVVCLTCQKSFSICASFSACLQIKYIRVPYNRYSNFDTTGCGESNLQMHNFIWFLAVNVFEYQNCLVGLKV